MTKIILGIDDEELERTALRTIISAEPGWTLIEARDGQEALELLHDGLRPQLCLVDLVMPKLGGLDLLRRIRRDPELRSLKAMVASATRDRATIIELAQLRIEGYLLKPFTAEKTLAALRPVLAGIPDAAVVSTTRNPFVQTVLVVAGDPCARSDLRHVIRRDPRWDIVEVGNRTEALDRLRSGLAPRVCLIDVDVRPDDGIALVSELRGDPSLAGLRVAVVSGEQDRERIRTLAELRIDGYLLKPLDRTKVHELLGRAVAAA